MSWLKKTLANAVGTQEPDYGPGAIQPVTEQCKTVSYTELTKDDLKWKGMAGTNVESQTFYFSTDEGITAMVQAIYSSVGNVRTTCQLNTKVFDHDEEKRHLFCTDTVNKHHFSPDRTAFLADKCSVALNADGTAYDIKSSVNPDCIVDLHVQRTAPGFKAGKDGISNFGTDPAKPWGSMRHMFWPRCQVTGTMKTKTQEYNLKGRGMFIHALQGMKPHHLAARWNFVNFQTPKYSAIMMEFTTPQSYGKTKVSVGGIARDGEILCAGVTSAKHLTTQPDPELGWPEPTSVEFKWEGKNSKGEPVHGEVSGPLAAKAERVDVMAHIPSVVKSVAGAVSGAKPYIYQYNPSGELSLKIKHGEEEAEEKGHLYFEATFISAI